MFFCNYYYYTFLVTCTMLIVATSSSSIKLPTHSDITTTLLRQRSLQQFSSLNDVFANVQISLPDAQVSRSGLDLTITNLLCRELSIQDMQLDHNAIPSVSTKQSIGTEVSGVQLSCTFRYNWSFTFFGGSGSGKATSDPTSSLSMDIDFISQDYTQYPPSDVKIENCETSLQVAKLEVNDDGAGIMSAIVSIFEGLLKDTIEDELSGLVCNELKGLAKEGGAFDSMLDMVTDKLDEYLLGYDPLPEDADPLFVEKNTIVPRNDDDESLWVNFQQLQDITKDLLDMELNQLMESVLSSSLSAGNANELAINSFVRNNVLDEDGILVLDPSKIINSEDAKLFEMHDTLAQTTMSIKSISVRGLDSFTEMNLLDPIGNYTLQNSFKLQSLTLQLEIEASIQASSKDDAIISTTGEGSAVVKENFVVEFTVNNIDVDFVMFLGINTQTLGNLQIGSIIHTENILQCFLGAIDEVQFTAMSVSVENIMEPTLSGFLDKSIDNIISTGAEALFSMYEQVIIQAMPNFFEMTLRDLVNERVEDALDGVDECPKPDATLQYLVDFRDLLLSEEDSVAMLGRGVSQYGDLFRTVYGFLNELMTSVDEDGLSWLNAFIVQFAGLKLADDGDIVFAGDLVRQSVDISLNGLNAAIDFGVSDVRVSNLDSIGALHLLQPTSQPAIVNSTASVGVGPKPIGMSMTLLIKGKGDKVDIHNELELGLRLHDLSAVLEVLAQIQEVPFLQFPLQDVTNINCWMATFVTPILDSFGIRVGEADTGLAIRKLAVAVAEARLTMKCIECSSPMMLELEETIQSQEGIADTSEVINMLFGYITNILGGNFVQSVMIDRRLAEAAYQCPHSPAYQQNFPRIQYEKLEPVVANEDSYDFLIAIAAVIGIIAVFATVIFFIAKWVSLRRHNRWLKTLSRQQQLELAKMQQSKQAKDRDLDQRMKALFLSKEVPCILRLLVPLVILGNVGLFLSGHLSLGGSVNLSGSFAGTDFDVAGFFDFSMMQTTIEMWHAGAKVLAVMIAIFSGAWPYTKLLITFLLWFVSPSCCCVTSKRRGTILHWLDILGKYSFVDIFVLVLTLASFRIQVESPGHLSFLPSELYSVNMVVKLEWGLYSNMLAQIVGAIISHVVIHYHRKTLRAATKAQAVELNLELPVDAEEYREKLRQHKFQLDYEASSKRKVVSRPVDWLLFGGMLVLVILLIVGCALPSFSIEHLGLVGLAVESGQRFEQAKKSFSVFDLATMIMDQARFIDQTSDYLGMGVLASVLVITVFLVPLAQAVSLTAQWFAPMTKKQRSLNSTFNEVLSAWQYLEVYVLSVVIAAWQLGGVSEFMINAYCGSLRNTFTDLAYYGILAKEDAQCFRANATVEVGSWILVAASLMLLFLNHFVGTASQQKHWDDTTPAEERLHSDRWQKSELSSTTERANTMDEVDEEATAPSDVNDEMKAKVSPISPRFTDYYFFATTTSTESRESSDIENCDVEIAVEPVVF